MRQVDHKNPLENYRNAQTVYKNSYLENTYPENYHPEHVPKGGAKTLDFSKAGSIRAYDKEEAQRYGGTNLSKNADERKTRLLRSGT